MEIIIPIAIIVGIIIIIGRKNSTSVEPFIGPVTNTWQGSIDISFTYKTVKNKQYDPVITLTRIFYSEDGTLYFQDGKMSKDEEPRTYKVDNIQSKIESHIGEYHPQQFIEKLQRGH